MEPWIQMAVTVVCAVLASGGLWAYLQKRMEKNDARTSMLLGLGHDRLVYLCMKYIERGWINNDEYEDLIKYLYAPYTDLGGNGTVRRLMEEVRKLPIKKLTYMQQIDEERKRHEEENSK